MTDYSLRISCFYVNFFHKSYLKSSNLVIDENKQYFFILKTQKYFGNNSVGFHHARLLTKPARENLGNH